MYVNGLPLNHYDAELQSGYSVQGASLETAYSALGQFPILLKQKVSLKKISVVISFFGNDPMDVYKKYSIFCSALLGKIELFLPDEFMYTSVLTDIADEQYVTEGVMEARFTFVGTKHGQLQTVTGNQVFCDSTLPKTDCILTATVGASGSNYKLGSVTFLSVTAGEVLCVDGITKRIIVNGVPAAQRAEWLEFPYLKPGLNTIDCKDPVTVEFYPAYF